MRGFDFGWFSDQTPKLSPGAISSPLVLRQIYSTVSATPIPTPWVIGSGLFLWVATPIRTLAKPSAQISRILLLGTRKNISLCPAAPQRIGPLRMNSSPVSSLVVGIPKLTVPNISRILAAVPGDTCRSNILTFARQIIESPTFLWFLTKPELAQLSFDSMAIKLTVVNKYYFP